MDYLLNRRLTRMTTEYISDPFATQVSGMVMHGIPLSGRLGTIFGVASNLWRRWRDQYEDFFDAQGNLTQLGRDVFDAYLRQGGFSASQRLWMTLTGRGRLVRALTAGEQALQEELQNQQAQGVTGTAATQAALMAGRAAYGAALAGGSSVGSALLTAAGAVAAILAAVGIIASGISAIQQTYAQYTQGAYSGQGGLVADPWTTASRNLLPQMLGWVPMLGDYLRENQRFLETRDAAMRWASAMGAPFEIPQGYDPRTALDYQMMMRLYQRGLRGRDVEAATAMVDAYRQQLSARYAGAEFQALRNELAQQMMEAMTQVVGSTEYYAALARGASADQAIRFGARDIALMQLFASGRADPGLLSIAFFGMDERRRAEMLARYGQLFAQRETAQLTAQLAQAGAGLLQVTPDATIAETLQQLADAAQQLMRRATMTEQAAQGIPAGTLAGLRARAQAMRERTAALQAYRQQEEYLGSVIQIQHGLRLAESTLGFRRSLLGGAEESTEATIERTRAEVESIQARIRFLEERRFRTEAERMQDRAEIASLRARLIEVIQGAPPMTAPMQTALTLASRTVALAQTMPIPLGEVQAGYTRQMQVYAERLRQLESYREQMIRQGLWNAAAEQQYQAEYSQALLQYQSLGAGAEQYGLSLLQARAGRIGAVGALEVEVARGAGFGALTQAIQTRLREELQILREQQRAIGQRQYLGEIGIEQAQAQIATLQSQAIQQAVGAAVLPMPYAFETQRGNLQTALQLMRTTFASWGDIRGTTAQLLRTEIEGLRMLEQHYRAVLPTLPPEARSAAENAFRQQYNAALMRIAGIQQQLEQGWMDRLISQQFNLGGNADLIAAEFTRREAALLYGIAPPAFGGTREQTRYWRETLPSLYSSLLGRIGTPEGMLETGVAAGEYNLNIHIMLTQEGNPTVTLGTKNVALRQNTQSFDTVAVRAGVNAQ